MKFLIIIVVILGVAAIAQAVKVHELAKKLSGKREEELSITDNNLNANLWIVTLAALVVSFFVLLFKYKDAMLPESASEHGLSLDILMNVNLWLVCGVFILMNILLMGFAWKYKYEMGRKAFYYPHNDKLEMIWTVIPALVMAIIIIYGLNVWNNITDDENGPDAITIQLYSKQFDWTARYAGADKVLGPSSFNFISGSNPLGIINEDVHTATIADLDAQIATIRTSLKNDVLSHTAEEEAEAKMGRLQRHKVRALGFNKTDPSYSTGSDDIVMDQGEFYIPVDREINFAINSRDVIHSAFMPHFRMQMNAVPGMTTSFRMTPILTTREMREKLDQEDFNFVLLCNKVCGASHYNMKMNVVVVEQDEYDVWLSKQKTFVDPGAAASEGLVDSSQNN